MQWGQTPQTQNSLWRVFSQQMRGVFFPSFAFTDDSGPRVNNPKSALESYVVITAPHWAFFPNTHTGVCLGGWSGRTISRSLLQLMSLSRWCHLAISSSVVPFSSCLHSFPASGSSPMSWLFPSGSQSMGVSASVFPMNIQGWFSLGLADLISLWIKGLSQYQSINSLTLSLLYGPTLTPIHDSRKAIALTTRTFVSKVMSLLFNMLSKFIIAFLPRSKCLLNFMAVVTIWSDFGVSQNKISRCFHCFPIYLPWSDGTGCHELKFSECWVLSQLFHSLLSLSSRDSSSLLSAIRLCHLHIWDYRYFSQQTWFQLKLPPDWHFSWCTLHVS